MDEIKILYKFIIIDRDTNDVVVKKTLRDVSEFINLVCKNKISHNNVRLKLLLFINYHLFKNILDNKIKMENPKIFTESNDDIKNFIIQNLNLKINH